MCGIVCAFDLKEKAEKLRPQLLEMSKKVRHRGPDWSGIYSNERAIMTHERLAIVDPASGQQPLFSDDKKIGLSSQWRNLQPSRIKSTIQRRLHLPNSLGLRGDFGVIQKERRSFY
jgi:asparagine synthase (glutamine-hydrolysing)